MRHSTDLESPALATYSFPKKEKYELDYSIKIKFYFIQFDHQEKSAIGGGQMLPVVFT